MQYRQRHWQRPFRFVLALVLSLATLLAAAHSPVAVSAAPVLTEFPPTLPYVPERIAAGPDGNVWFSEILGNRISRITPAGVITQFPIPTPDSRPLGITAAPDGNIWFTEGRGGAIGRITPTGVITEFRLPYPQFGLARIAADAAGNLWYTMLGGHLIGRLTPAGVSDVFTVPTAYSDANEIAAGPDGNLWFTESVAGKIGRLTAAGAFTEFALPQLESAPLGIAAGPDGNLWFTESRAGKLGRITPGGTITEFQFPGQLPEIYSPEAITLGPDGKLWFTMRDQGVGFITPAGDIHLVATTLPANSLNATAIATGADGHLWLIRRGVNRITRLATTGSVEEFPSPQLSHPQSLVVGPDGAFWFTTTEGNAFGRMTLDGAMTTYPLPATSCNLTHLVVGPDANFWFTEWCRNRIGRITTAGVVTEFPLPYPDSQPTDITVGPDGNLWFTEFADRLGQITPTGVITEFPTPPGSHPGLIAAGPDGNVWFTTYDSRIGRMTPQGSVVTFALPGRLTIDSPSYSSQIIVGPDGNLWSAAGPYPDSILRISTSGVITAFPIPGATGGVSTLAVGPDGNIWFADTASDSHPSGGTRIGRITLDGVLTQFQLLLPESNATSLVTGPDGNLWFTEAGTGKLGRLALGVTPASPCAASCTLAVTSIGEGTITPGGGVYPNGTPVTLTATAPSTPGAASSFVGWRIDGVVAGRAPTLTLAMSANHTVQALFTAAPATFSDVPADHPAFGAINQLTAEGLIRGYGDGRFGPDEPIVRAQVAALIARAVGWEDEAHGNAFPDRCAPAPPAACVDLDLWRNVGALSSYGVAQGYQDGTFGPRDEVLSAQVISLIARAFIQKGLWQQQPDNSLAYPNVADPTHRRDIATFIRYAGPLPGTSSATDPWPTWDHPATRAWVAQALAQALSSLDRH